MSNRLSSDQIYQIIQRDWMQRRLHYRVATRSWSLDDSPVTTAQLARLIANRCDTSMCRVTNCLEQVTLDEVSKEKKKIVDWCKANDRLPRCDAELNRYLNLMERPGLDDQRRHANIFALKQWLWLVKRGIMKLPTEWHIALIFWSRENGTGKSYNVRRILAPVVSRMRNLSVDDLTEKFSGAMFADTLVAFLDEFAGVEKIGESILKSILTGKPWDQRAIYSDSGFYADNRTSAVATSNKEPPHGFIDTTGARRFWSIHCNGISMDRSPERKAQFDNLDVDRIWAAVNSSDPSPHSYASSELLSYMGQVRDRTLRSQTSVETFMEEETELTELTFKVPMKEFHEAYGQYCFKTKQQMVKGGYKKLAEALTSLGVPVVKNGNRMYIKGRCLSSLESQ